MKEKLTILMQNENLTASRLANILEVQPAVVSHILHGRNKPSFELICKLVNRFPQINPYWLLGDAEEIYSSGVAKESSGRSSSSASATMSVGGTLFDVVGATIAPEGVKSNIPEAVASASTIPYSRTSSEVARIIVVYKDNTFEELLRR